MEEAQRVDATLPHDLDAEQATLSGLYLDPDKLDQLDLKPADFYDARNRDIFKAMQGLQRQGLPLTWVRLHQECSQLGSYLAKVFDYEPSSAYLFDHAKVVREKAIKRALLVQVARISERANNGTQLSDLSDMLTEAQDGLTEAETPAALFTSIGELLDLPDEPIPWAVHEMLPHGALTIIAADSGAGKSTWLRDMAVCVAQGRKFMGREVKQGPVLLFSLEEYKPMVGQHMRKMGATHDDPIHIRFDPLDDAVSQVRAAIERLKPALIVIDPLPKFTLIDDLNSYGQVSPAMDALVQLAHEGTGTNIVVVTHTNKEGEDKRPGGSIAFSASADVILHLAVEGEDRRRVLSGVKNRFDERYLLEPTVLGLNPETGHIESQGTKAEAVYHDLAAEMLDWLREQEGPQRQTDLLKAVKGRTNDKSKTVQRLKDVGKIDRYTVGKGFVCCLVEQHTPSSTPTPALPQAGVLLENAALPLPPLITGGRGRANEEAKMQEKCIPISAGPGEGPSQPQTWVEDAKGLYVSTQRIPGKDGGEHFNTQSNDAQLPPEEMLKMWQTAWAALPAWKPDSVDGLKVMLRINLLEPHRYATPEYEADGPVGQAMLLADLLTRIEMNDEERAVMAGIWGEPYNPEQVGIGVLRCVDALSKKVTA